MANHKIMSPMSAGIAGAAVGAVGSAIAIALMNKNTRKKVVQRADALRQHAASSVADLRDRGMKFTKMTNGNIKPTTGRSRFKKKTNGASRRTTFAPKQ